MAAEKRKKYKKKAGPKPENLRIDGNWEDALKKGVTKNKPKGAGRTRIRRKLSDNGSASLPIIILDCALNCVGHHTICRTPRFRQELARHQHKGWISSFSCLYKQLRRENEEIVTT